MCEEDDPDLIALRGHPSDKLPGAAGVGPKRAAQLVQRYGTLDGVLEVEALAPLPSLADQKPTWASASTLPAVGS
jgi:DNA polymerase-1